jgi:hypothetical protein
VFGLDTVQTTRRDNGSELETTIVDLAGRTALAWLLALPLVFLLKRAGARPGETAVLE